MSRRSDEIKETALWVLLASMLVLGGGYLIYERIETIKQYDQWKLEMDAERARYKEPVSYSKSAALS